MRTAALEGRDTWIEQRCDRYPDGRAVEVT
jgi:hypothetical protein